MLLPLVRRGADLHLAFVLRAVDGRAHSGQIAFPGGGRHRSDRDAVATALREAREETGILPEHVVVLGHLNDGPTISRYMVTPVVGYLPEPPEYRPDPREVQEVFEVPLRFLLDETNERRKHPIPLLSLLYPMYEYRFEGRTIWGVTGKIVHDFLVCARGF